MKTKLILLTAIASFALQSHAVDFSFQARTQPHAAGSVQECREALFVAEKKRNSQGIIRGKN